MLYTPLDREEEEAEKGASTEEDIHNYLEKIAHDYNRRYLLGCQTTCIQDPAMWSPPAGNVSRLSAKETRTTSKEISGNLEEGAKALYKLRGKTLIVLQTEALVIPRLLENFRRFVRGGGRGVRIELVSAIPFIPHLDNETSNWHDLWSTYMAIQNMDGLIEKAEFLVGPADLFLWDGATGLKSEPKQWVITTIDSDLEGQFEPII